MLFMCIITFSSPTLAGEVDGGGLLVFAMLTASLKDPLRLTTLGTSPGSPGEVKRTHFYSLAAV